MSVVTIRPAEPEDAAGLTRLAQRAKAHWPYPADWLALWKRELTITPEYLAANLAFVACLERAERIEEARDADDKPLGVCVLQRIPFPSLEHVWVEPDWHGRGIGRALVERALATARELGFRRVEVQADPNAGDFYSRLGAELIGAVPAPMPGAPTRTLPLYEFRLN